MGKKIFIIGGAQSGKSSFAIKLAKSISDSIVFIATATPCDEEMKAKINLHKKTRAKIFNNVALVEEPIEIEQAIKKVAMHKIIIIDCITFWVSNLLIHHKNKDKVIFCVNKFASTIKKINHTIIMVSNEVGSGIVPNNKIGRIYRDCLGKTNQIIANISDEVYFMIAGIPTKIK